MNQNNLAKTLKSLHTPSQPLVILNAWDISSLKTLLSLNSDDDKPVKAIATASFAIAESLGIRDEELTYDQNFAAIEVLAPLCVKANIPLSADLQDGYGPRLSEAVGSAIRAGVVGANIEDSIPSTGALYDIEEQVRRLKLAIQAAHVAGCPNFVINARCDVFFPRTSVHLNNNHLMEEAIARGKAYLEAGATTVFFWGGSKRGLSQEEVTKLSEALGGRISVKAGTKPDSLSTRELATIGVARISVGPSLYNIAMEAVKKASLGLLSGGKLV